MGRLTTGRPECRQVGALQECFATHCATMLCNHVLQPCFATTLCNHALHLMASSASLSRLLTPALLPKQKPGIQNAAAQRAQHG